MKKRTKKQLKRRLLIGLVVTMLGYLCMQEALFVQDTMGKTEKSAQTVGEEFRKTSIKKITENGIVFLNNASETGLTFTEEQKTMWDEIVNKINNSSNEFIPKTKEMSSKLNQMEEKKSKLSSDRYRKLEEFIKERNKPLEEELEETQKAISTLRQQIEKIKEDIQENPKPKTSELDPLKQKIRDLEDQLLPLREKETELSCKIMSTKWDFYRTYEHKKLLNDLIDLELQTANMKGELSKLADEYYSMIETLGSQLYEIYIETKGGK